MSKGEGLRPSPRGRCQSWVEFSDTLLASKNCLSVWREPHDQVGIGSRNPKELGLSPLRASGGSKRRVLSWSPEGLLALGRHSPCPGHHRGPSTSFLSKAPAHTQMQQEEKRKF